jgi:hypothetical protein
MGSSASKTTRSFNMLALGVFETSFEMTLLEIVFAEHFLPRKSPSRSASLRPSRICTRTKPTILLLLLLLLHKWHHVYLGRLLRQKTVKVANDRHLSITIHIEFIITIILHTIILRPNSRNRRIIISRKRIITRCLETSSPCRPQPTNPRLLNT